MRLRPRVRALTGGAIVCLAVLSLRAQTSGAFSVGVLRRDGVIVPFADYDGKRWRAMWGEPAERVEVPIDLRNIPSRWWGKSGPRDLWQVWVPSQEARVVHVRQPDWIQAQCVQQIGLRTDYRSSAPPPPRDAQPYPKDGLAVSPLQAIERIDVIPAALPPPPVVEAFNAAEQTAVRDSIFEGGFGRVMPDARERDNTLPKVEAMYAVGDPAGTRVYYLELSREYETIRAQCPLVTFGGGWFARDGASELRKLRFDVSIVDCDRNGLTYMLPLGAVRLSDRLFWIAQWSGWDYEEYGVVEIKPKRIDDVVRVLGGQC